jgi:acetoacetyl-CoA synthetase
VELAGDRLASGATLLLYDGSPFVGRGSILFDYADAEAMTHFGTSAKFIDAIAKIELKPRQTHKLTQLRAMLSTGSPLVPEGFDYVYANIKPDLQLASVSGGTDIISCFVLGNPGPVHRGEIQCPDSAWRSTCSTTTAGRCAAEGRTGVHQALPGDADRLLERRYGRSTTPPTSSASTNEHLVPRRLRRDHRHGGFIIYGRSDATLNPGGVRIGTAEIYRQVEKLARSGRVAGDRPGLAAGNSGDVRVVLFVKLREGLVLDEAMVGRIKQVIRDNTTPRHVPAKVLQVA